MQEGRVYSIGGNRVDGMDHKSRRANSSNDNNNNNNNTKHMVRRNATIPLPSHTHLRCTPSLFFRTVFAFEESDSYCVRLTSRPALASQKMIRNIPLAV
ncbi:hypothetical protein M441DRAFT_293882 [Trichoderma asperellum CBS 433.97]|uniref:Uncharacterized protein n=1 Tax=Trichoderma asperellum (strain ATCC 204424 / CBS 433.97 / NBRC 101777) TaxID=1042311 RepID=A0A2T3YTD6_TRIA4|nr:hypothetical protein M441DRAFT_293882 [Trichoderma asperellum CBS 433.97]PTB35797.1 hypothetical protein M441DRAFT_293882 [Trichoderma asperellum CBS 433.97]